jgi:asparagine synthase (glutamine-hydrolysing)
MQKAGLFQRKAFTRELRLQRRLGKSTPRRAVFDYALTAVLATQLFVHTYFGGGLCELPTWSDWATGGSRATSRE